MTPGPTVGYLNDSSVSSDQLSGKIFNGPLHATLIVLIALVTVVVNLLIAFSARRDSSRTCVSRALLELICLVDAFGAVLVLVFPFCVAVTSTGRWVLGEMVCHIDAACNVFVWLQHFIFVVASKFDSAYTTHVVKASVTSCNVSQLALRRVKIFAVISTLSSFTLSSIVTAATGGHFHRVLLLCIPDVPTTFYVVVVVLYFAAVIATAVGHVVVVFNAKRQQRKIYCLASASSTITAITHMEMVKSDVHAQIIRSAWASFGVTVACLVVTLPTAILIGLPQFENRVPLIVYLLSDVVVYSEFLLNPMLLIVVNSRTRKDVRCCLRSVLNRLLCCRSKLSSG